jgi:shikimate kinase
MDALILTMSGRPSIVDMFDLDGEGSYRALETQVAERLASATECVISTGGGVVEHAPNMAALSRGGRVIYLRAALETIERRLEDDASRPLMRTPKHAHARFRAREPLYRRYADHLVDTDELTAPDVVRAIRRRIGR